VFSQSKTLDDHELPKTALEAVHGLLKAQGKGLI